MVKIGFTGTQKGMSAHQSKEIQFWLKLRLDNISEFHHGDCIGADAQAHGIAKRMGIIIIIHPPDDPRKRAFCVGAQKHPERPYLLRNHHIVDECDILLATPKEHEEIIRSGTWATIRHARKERKKVKIFYP